MADLSKRVEALEAQNAEILSRLDALEKGGKKPLRPSSSSGALNKSMSKSSIKSNGAALPSSESQKSLSKSSSKPDLNNRRASLESAGPAIDPARVGSYYVGKKKIYYVVPADYKEAGDAAAAPKQDLKLEYIFGYNGKTARNNVFFVDKDGGGQNIVYCVAGTGVFHDLRTHGQKFFTGHNEDIVSLAVHPKLPLVATGQVDPKGSGLPFICVWDYHEQKEVTRLEGFHTRGIIALAFSPDGTKLASVGDDDNHTIGIWNWETDKKKPFVESLTSKDLVYGVVFNQYAPAGELEFATCGQKVLKFWDMKKEGDRFVLKGNIASTFKATNVVQKAYYSAVYLPSGDCVVGTDTGDLYVFKAQKFVKAIKAHEGKIGAVAAGENGGFISGGADGKIRLWDADGNAGTVIETGKRSPVAIDYFHGRIMVGSSNNSLLDVDSKSKEVKVVVEGHSAEIWALAIHPSKPVFVSGAHDRFLRFWDYSKKEAVKGKVWECPAGKPDKKGETDGIRSAAFSPDGSLLAVGLRSGTVVLLEFETLKVKWEKVLHKEQVDAVAFSPNGQLLATGSWDQMVSLVELESYSSITLRGHTSSITHLTFSSDSKFLQTDSRDYEILYWDTENGKRIERNVVADVDWSNWTCILGWPVKAIFGKGFDGTDVNACNITHSKSLIATGDDFGGVSLFRYPAASKDQNKKTYPGHSSHVTNVRFTPDEKHLVSTGGADYGVFVWGILG